MMQEKKTEPRIRTADQIYWETEEADAAISQDMIYNKELWEKLSFKESMDRMIQITKNLRK